MGGLDSVDERDEVVFGGPDDALLDTSGCPVPETYAGRGATSAPHAVTATFLGHAGLRFVMGMTTNRRWVTWGRRHRPPAATVDRR
ncbi:hypothetical protein GCM10029964_093110 [Kibdelosporangium lantanae]